MYKSAFYDREQKRILCLFIIIIISASAATIYTLQFAEHYAQWIGLFWVTLLSNSFIAIPHEPLYIEMGKSESVISLLLVSIIPTITGCMLDYLFLKPVVHLKKLKSIRGKKSILTINKWFLKFPGGLIFLFAVSPLPFYFVRIISLMTHYPFWRYALYSLLGRMPRYCILALLGFSFRPPTWALVLLFILMLFLPVVIKFAKNIVNTSPEN